MTSLWLISAHRPWGVFTGLSGEVIEGLKGLRHSRPTFYMKTPFFLQLQSSSCSFSHHPISDNILPTDITVENLDSVEKKPQNNFTQLTTYLEKKVNLYYVYSVLRIIYHGTL